MAGYSWNKVQPTTREVTFRIRPGATVQSPWHVVHQSPGASHHGPDLHHGQRLPGHHGIFLSPSAGSHPQPSSARYGGQTHTRSSPKSKKAEWSSRDTGKMGDLNKFIDEALKSHNTHRANHSAPSLKLNRDICRTAQTWADHLAKTNSFQHSKDREYKGDKMGENIAMKYSSGMEYYSGQEATDQWYSEIEKYNFSRHQGPGTGHFTQVVWKDSREFGIGKAQTKDGKWLVVANYYPAGNFIGRNAENVLPPRNGKCTAPKPEAKSGGPSGFGSGKASPMSSGQSSSAEGRLVSRSEKTETRNGVTKTIVTETTEGPNGERRTVTREETRTEGGASGGGASSFSGHKPSTYGGDFDQKFRSMGFDNGDQPRGGSSNNGYQHRHEVAAADKKEKDKKPQKMKDFIDDVIKAHNKYRKLHGKVGDLKHSKDLTVLAQRWADHLGVKSALGHSNDTYKGEPLGENVATKWSSVGTDYTGQQATEQWYEEIAKYDFGSAHFTQGTGHFTQVVWKGSKEIGVGKAFGKDGRVFCVCNYFPAGNFQGQFPDNVLPPKK